MDLGNCGAFPSLTNESLEHHGSVGRDEVQEEEREDLAILTDADRPDCLIQDADLLPLDPECERLLLEDLGFNPTELLFSPEPDWVETVSRLLPSFENGTDDVREHLRNATFQVDNSDDFVSLQDTRVKDYVSMPAVCMHYKHYSDFLFISFLVPTTSLNS